MLPGAPNCDRDLAPRTQLISSDRILAKALTISQSCARHPAFHVDRGIQNHPTVSQSLTSCRYTQTSQASHLTDYLRAHLSCHSSSGRNVFLVWCHACISSSSIHGNSCSQAYSYSSMCIVSASQDQVRSPNAMLQLCQGQFLLCALLSLDATNWLILFFLGKRYMHSEHSGTCSQTASTQSGSPRASRAM